jgi:hypothetical protein
MEIKVGCLDCCVWRARPPIINHRFEQSSKRPPTRIANYPTAAVHSTGRSRRRPALRIARNNSFIAALSLGRPPRVLMISAASDADSVLRAVYKLSCESPLVRAVT